MIIKTFVGKELDAVLGQIREELGSDAVILGLNSATEGLVEVQVGLDSSLHAASLPTEPAPLPIFPKERENLANLLDAQHVSPHGRQVLLACCEGKFSGDPQTVLSRSIGKAVQFDSEPFDRARIFSFVGPQGAGKTTTIAKIATKLRQSFDLKIGLVGAYPFQRSAGYQLHTYASLLQMPCRMAEPGVRLSTEVRRMIRAFSTCDIILIDTPSWDISDAKTSFEVRDALRGLEGLENFLVLPTTAQPTELNKSWEHFSRFKLDSIILNKIDDCGFVGPALEIAMKSGKPLSFFGNGHRIPDDIEAASPGRLALMLARSVH